MSNSASDPAATAADIAAPNLHALRRRLGNDYRIFLLARDADVQKIGIVLPDGAAIAAKLARNPR